MSWGWNVPEWNGAIGWLVFGSVLMFVGSLALLPVIIVRMPHDYFTRKRPPEDGRRSAVRLLLRVLKNVLGALIALLGVLLIFTPGQGLMTIFVGVTLLDFPGKRRAEIAILGRPGVLGPINRLRTKLGHRPLEMPPRASPRPK
ncbi:MAG: hypothetical protein KF708_02200 [Pirellulales bacterium]|nr:hypothetical protein [Pirellulales bacterium]